MDGKGPSKKKASPKATPRDGVGAAVKKPKGTKKGGTTPRPDKAAGESNPLGGTSAAVAAAAAAAAAAKSDIGTDAAAALRRAGSDQLDADKALLERLQSILGPLKVAAEIEQAQQAGQVALHEAEAALASVQPPPSTPSSLFARWVGRSPAPTTESSSRNTAPPVVILDPLASHWHGLLVDTLSSIDALIKERRESVLATSSGVATNVPAPPSLVKAQKELGVSAAILKLEKAEPTDSLRRREMRGEGLDLPSGWVETAAARLRPGAAASIFGDARQTSLERKEQRKTANNWATTLALASSAIEHAKIGGGARVSDPEYAVLGGDGAAGGGGRLAKSKIKRAAKLWAKVAKMALPGRWSPRPDEGAVHHTAHHVKRTGEGFPKLADPHGLLGDYSDEEEEEYEDYGDDDAEEIANVGLPALSEAEEAESAIMYDKVVPGGDGYAGAQATKEEAVE